jgi:alkanesulfonate monooxygenase SsuD/methylene tetrahydromethanopterin reductase-like flavin-dependent oxidoreductase (luciferase family)
VTHVNIGIKTSPQSVDFATLDAAWARIAEHDVFGSVWMNDHLTDPGRDRGGPSWEALTLTAALAHRVPGRWLGHGVLANTFRHPSVLAKQATLLDHVTGGRFIVGIGAGWHAFEHESFGIPLPPMPERFDRFVSAVHVLRALFSEAAGREPGVTRDDPFYPLEGALNEPPPLTPGGPPVWLGGQKRRGLALAAEIGDGWLLPAIIAEEGWTNELDYFSDRRDKLLAGLERAGRDASTFSFAAQVGTGRTRRERAAALNKARDAIRRGATHVILGMPAALGAAGVDTIAAEVAQPLRDSIA